MARPVRLEAEDAVVPIVTWGNERKAVFRDDRDRQEYLDRLIRCRDRFGLRVLASCLMGNPLHLAIWAGPLAGSPSPEWRDVSAETNRPLSEAFSGSRKT